MHWKKRSDAGGERKRSGATLTEDNVADDAPSSQIYELFSCRSNNVEITIWANRAIAYGFLQLVIDIER